MRPGWPRREFEFGTWPRFPLGVDLLFMRAFAEAYPEPEKVKQLVSQLPWGHVVRLIQRIKEPRIRDWYAGQCIRQGWSRSMLEMHVHRRAHARQGKAITNFQATLPPADSELASQVFKDLNLYLSAVDDLLRHPDDKPTIGLLLCRSKNKLVVSTP